MSAPHAVIVAGGRATRMGALADQRPKALLPFGSTTLLGHHLAAVSSCGIGSATVLAGHLAGAIEQELPALTPPGLAVDLVVEPTPDGSGGCLRHLPPRPGPLLVIFADVMAWMDYAELVRTHRATGTTATVVVHPNDHPADSDLVEADGDNWVRRIHRKPRPPETLCRNLAAAGVFVLEPATLPHLPNRGPADLVHDLIAPLVARGDRVFAYRTTEYLKDCGTPERYGRVRSDYDRGEVHGRYRGMLRPTLFIDRDGTLNRERGHIRLPEQVELLPGVGAAVRRLNQAGVLAVVVTNQPVVARGECTADGMERIHARLEQVLGEAGAFLDGIYYCPHHPDRGFPGEVESLKVACGCRKPEPGLVRAAMNELPIDLSRAAVIGDSERDVSLARRLGLPAFLVGADGAPADPEVEAVPDFAAGCERWLSRLTWSQAKP